MMPQRLENGNGKKKLYVPFGTVLTIVLFLCGGLGWSVEKNYNAKAMPEIVRSAVKAELDSRSEFLNEKFRHIEHEINENTDAIEKNTANINLLMRERRSK